LLHEETKQDISNVKAKGLCIVKLDKRVALTKT